MSDIDERLRHAGQVVRVRCAALGLEAMPHAEPRRSRRRPLVAVAAGLLVTTIVAVAVLGVVLHRHQRSSSVTVGPPASPSQIVALEAFGGRIAVISAADGHVIRVLAETRGLIRYRPTLAVTPDSSAVYFTTSRRPHRNECIRGLVDEVARVSITGGPVTAIGPGVFPAISPDGYFLAYSRNARNPCSTNHDQLVILDLRTGVRHILTSPSVDLEFLSWAPDSVHLAYNDDGAQPNSPRLIDTATARSLSDATHIPHANADWAGFLGTTSAGIGVVPRNGSSSNPARVVELKPVTGVVTRTLFTVPGGLAVGNTLDGPEDTLHADRSGRDVLAIGLLPVHAAIRHGALYRWHDGDTRPTLIADQIWAAAWIEPTAKPTSPNS